MTIKSERLFVASGFILVKNIALDCIENCFIEKFQFLVKIFVLKYIYQVKISNSLIIDCESNFSSSGGYSIFKLEQNLFRKTITIKFSESSNRLGKHLLVTTKHYLSYYIHMLNKNCFQTNCF